MIFNGQVCRFRPLGDMLEKLHYAKSRFSAVLNDVLRYNTYRATSHVNKVTYFFAPQYLNCYQFALTK